MSAEPTVMAPAARRRPRLALSDAYDLLLALGLGLLLPGLLLLPVPLLRIPLGLAAGLFVPGYVLTAALFPYRDDLERPARLGLSLGLSAALFPPLALLLDMLPWGIRPWPIAIALSIWITAVSGVALLRRGLAGPAADLPPAPEPPSWWRAASTRRRASYGVAALALTAFLGAGFVALLTPERPPTEFYALGLGGLAEDYPRAARVGEPVQVTVGIVNNEPTAHAYSVEIWAGSGWDEAGHTLLSREPPVAIAPGARLERQLTWAMPRPGPDQFVDLLLVRAGEEEPFRQLRLWLDVTEV